ncbi:phasin family protein [Variovorax sp. H27-G14]|uniref:phasin family protein n=1 Tax=Variovorax sp. H27-G14 TaxID=3111914 RepID=UPI0038FCFFDA
MATRSDETAKLKKRAAPAKAARKTPAAKKAAPRKAAPAAKKATQPGKAEGLLRAGLKALDTVRHDVAKRQANVIEGLLGIRQGKVPSLDSFGIRKFEDVFDQRVATALERLGMPPAQEVQGLRDEVARLRERVAQLEGTHATQATQATRATQGIQSSQGTGTAAPRGRAKR